ncbi:LysR substrate-binding domain-containing protein [Variovorax sp. JS1663]|uniref:LysR substrate-binding domain-containing protein n=1 Tax=Variovorax sp. JS1663 TaxID=1851577 RepID=UPI000B34896C|nr:LysR substrate-binding domain-containing protein [Variovorax sp. JS1663]OUM02161.1 LysR family transcriptional regulator [Variovorax sp. JS1663]
MRRRLPSTQALICFEAAARHESYTRAAQELALTQSAVSRQITALEDFLGMALFRRTRHGVALTPAGADYARQISRQLDSMERDTLDAMARQGVGGALQLAAVPTFATRWLIPRLPGFAARHPDITVHIETRTRPFLFNDTTFDAALYAGTPAQAANWAGTRSVLLLAEDVLPVCSPALLGTKAQMSPSAIARMPLLQQSTRPDGWHQWFDAQKVDAPRARSGPRYELFSMIAVAAAHGLGVALMPRMLIEPELKRGELVVACDRPLRAERGYFLVTPASGEERPALAAFRDWLMGEAAGPP